MGSGASSHVTEYVHGDSKPPNSDGKDEKTQRPTSTGRLKKDTKVMPINSDDISKMHQEVTKCRKLLEESEARFKDSEINMKLMETQMAEIEGQNLELQDQVTSLQQQLEDSALTSTGHVDNYSETLHAKDQYIGQIERESQNSQADITKLRRKFKRKLRAMSTQLSEVKQGHTLQLFELQAEQQKLQEDNHKLMAQVGKAPAATKEGAENAAEFTDGRTKIILELSAKVSDQDDKIISLDKLLREKEQEIAGLQQGNGAKEAASETSVWSTTSDQSPPGRNTTWSQKFQRNSASQKHGSEKKETWNNHEDNNELTSIAQDVKRLLKKQRKPVGRCGNEVDQSPDHRQSSGMSRDSGIVALSDAKGAGANHTQDSDWGDSDTDAEDTVSLHQRDSKPSSAQSRLSTLTSEYSDLEPTLTGTTELDPASIRRISAAKMRKGSNPVSSASSCKSTDRKVGGSLGKPPPYIQPSSGYKLNSEVDSLIQSIDSSGFGSRTGQAGVNAIFVP